MQTLRDHVSSVYDITVVYEGPNKVNNRTPPPSMFSKSPHLQRGYHVISTIGYFDGRCSCVHIHVKRTPIADIPQVGLISLIPQVVVYSLGRGLLLLFLR